MAKGKAEWWKDERRIYCKFCGAKLKKDRDGLYCPTKNCQWSLGFVEEA